MGKLLEYISVITVFSLCNVNCNKFTRLERLIQMQTGRLDSEIISIQQQNEQIFEKLDMFETFLNESKGCFRDKSRDEGTSLSLAESLHMSEQMGRMIKAFQEEKKMNQDFHSQLLNIKQVEAVQGAMEWTRIIEEIRETMCSSAELSRIKDELTMFVKSDIRETLHNVVGTVQNLSAKFDTGELVQTTIARPKPEGNTVMPFAPTSKKMYSCLAYYNEGVRDSGIYTVYPTSEDNPVRVYCDMTTDDGGWTVFQRRQDGSVGFLRRWAEYKQGFGNLTGEFWLGNDNIAALTSTCCQELRVDLSDFENNKAYAKYKTFKVLPESANYKLELGSYSGNAGDSLEDHTNMAFSTVDRDNDKNSGNCAFTRKGAWWYKSCYHSHLNGLYLKGISSDIKAMNWFHWKRSHQPLKFSEMKLR